MTSSEPLKTGSAQPFAIRHVTAGDVRSALSAGYRDFFRKPFLSAFFGLVYTLFGLVFIAGLFVYEQIWMIVPAGVGFPLIAPFVAVGLYEMSRRYAANENFAWKDIFLVIFKQQRREFGWMAFVVLFVFWVWIYQIRLLLALFLQWQSFSSLQGLWEVMTTTTNGILFLIIGTLVGGVLATILFCLTVIAMPLLLDKEVDFVSAMLASIKTVQTSPIVMLSWGLIVAVIVLLAIVPAFAGVIFALPILGHTTWHLYRVAIEDKPTDLTLTDGSTTS